MAKVINCSDTGMHCHYIIRAETEQEALDKAAQHAKEQHGVSELSPEMASKVKAAVHDEP